MLLLVLGCRPPTPVDFGDPALLGPLEDLNRAPAIPAEGTDTQPESVVLLSGFDAAADHHWTHARAWVHSDAAATWAALRDLDVMADRRAVDEYRLAAEGVEPDFDFSFVLDHRVQDLITLQFELTWVHELQEGTADEPSYVVARWDKTDGTPFIDLLSGTVEIRAVEPDLTELACISHLRASGRDATGMEQYWRDLHADILAHLAGRPLPDLDP